MVSPLGTCHRHNTSIYRGTRTVPSTHRILPRAAFAARVFPIALGLNLPVFLRHMYAVRNSAFNNIQTNATIHSSATCLATSRQVATHQQSTRYSYRLPSSAANFNHFTWMFIYLPRLGNVSRRFTTACRLAPVNVVIPLGGLVLDKDPFEDVVALRTAQEIVHVWVLFAVARLWRCISCCGKPANIVLFVTHELGEKPKQTYAVARSLVCVGCVSSCCLCMASGLFAHLLMSLTGRCLICG